MSRTLAIAVAFVCSALVACDQSAVDPSSDATAVLKRGGKPGGGGGGGGGGTSPDPAVAFVATEKNTPVLKLVDADGGNETALYKGEKFGFMAGPTWSNDGTRLAFKETGAGDLKIIGVADGSVTNLEPGCSCSYDWSPVAPELVVADGAVDAAASSRLRLVPAGGSAGSVLWTPTDGSWVSWPTWRPDGGAVAFVLRDPADTEVVSVHVLEDLGGSGTAITALPSGTHAGIGSMDWATTAGGDQLLTFSARPAGSPTADDELFELNVGTGALTDLGVVGENPGWAPAAADLAYTDSRGKVRTLSGVTLARAGRHADWKH